VAEDLRTVGLVQALDVRDDHLDDGHLCSLVEFRGVLTIPAPFEFNFFNLPTAPPSPLTSLIDTV
jgi:hypothetical protein